jgi:hypothetical protein
VARFASSRISTEARITCGHTHNVAFVLGAFVPGAFVLGAFVLGAFVLGAFVLGAFVLGAFVLGVCGLCETARPAAVADRETGRHDFALGA